MTTKDIITARTENNEMLSLQNDAAGWIAFSRGTYHIIEWDNGNFKFYKNSKSWATRVSRLIRTGK